MRERERECVRERERERKKQQKKHTSPGIKSTKNFSSLSTGVFLKLPLDCSTSTSLIEILGTLSESKDFRNVLTLFRKDEDLDGFTGKAKKINV